MLRPSVALLLLVSSGAASIAQEPAIPPLLSTGIELCLRDGHSNEQYRDELTKLGALPVPEEQRKLSETGLNSKEEWTFTFNGTRYLTSFLWANTFCGVLGPADKKDVVAAVTGPPLKFTYYGIAAGDASQDIYRGQFDGDAATIMISSHRPNEVFLVFVIDKMWDVFPGGPNGK
jgi:hypothetical protein